MHRTNIRGTFVVSQQAARQVQEGGARVNFSTPVACTPFPSYGPYSASKAAAESLTLTLPASCEAKTSQPMLRRLGRPRGQRPSYCRQRSTCLT
ncbi:MULTISPECIES: SDR family NAD(P)-dependent oxidoreductase [unclassified Salinibacterium]|uniref:SDR family NAD(P)-dependent oxidoreductase n=1 Tax=unclassified Salinibacterium TaxID=2632331 RepID=UPI0034D43C8D